MLSCDSVHADPPDEMKGTPARPKWPPLFEAVPDIWRWSRKGLGKVVKTLQVPS
jgi:hypothetical protein